MHLLAYRKSTGRTQAQLAKELGLRSKSYVSRIETGAEVCPMKLALRIEELSSGRVPALSLVSAEDAKLLRTFAGQVAEAGQHTAAGGRA